jgi:multidrug efflux pump
MSWQVRQRSAAVNFSYQFIRRPIGTTLAAIGLFIIGAVAYAFLPVASMPSVDLPTIVVLASQPGADPATIAATVGAPLERHLSHIAGVSELTSRSTLGSTMIAIQFDLDRNIDHAARDVEAALNAATADLPILPRAPILQKVNPASAPILSLALTSETLSPNALYDIADSVIVQRISKIDGVGRVNVTGAASPAIRVQVNPAVLASMGLGLEDVRDAIAKSNAAGPTGMFDGSWQSETIATNAQLRSIAEYNAIVIRNISGTIVRLADVATIREGPLNALSAAWFERDPSILIYVAKQPNANVINTVDRVHDELAKLRDSIPADVKISVLSDRTVTIRASIREMQVTLAVAAVVVTGVVFLFLRRGALTFATAVTVPLTLAGTCALIWAAGFSLNNLSLMALAVVIGVVIDDAVVMIENTSRYIERGSPPLLAAIESTRQIGFTVVAISISLIAALIPLLFMGGITGRFLRELSVTFVCAVVISAVVSLSVSPMICAHFVREPLSRDATWFDCSVDMVLSALIRFYAGILRLILDSHWSLSLLVLLATVALTVVLYINIPKGFIPQDDAGIVTGVTEASADVSFSAMTKLQRRVSEIVMADGAVATVASSVGGGSAVNQGNLLIRLKPLEQRKEHIFEIIDRLREKLSVIIGAEVFLMPVGDIRVGTRQSKAQYQFTLWSSDINELQAWVSRIVDRLKLTSELTDVSTDREQDGLRANVVIDRRAAARLCVQIQDIDNALNDAFAQRPISMIYMPRNQYWVLLEVVPRLQRDPSTLDQIYVTAGSIGGCTVTAGDTAVSPGNQKQVPLSAVAHVEKSLAPLAVNHQGQFPSITITYNLKVGTPIQRATDEIARTVADMHLPDGIQTAMAGDAHVFVQSAGIQPFLIMAAIVAVYLVLGLLYESLVHPLTIISTLPSAGLGALLALQLSGREFNLVGFIGIILLIGIVTKNGVMLVDFALEGERQRRLSASQAIYEASIERFRPILMTTMASMLGAVPLATATGYGSEIRRPLGIAIIGGLVASQVMTLCTTPVIYLLLAKLQQRLLERL